ncbi:MAG: MBL fold metallo-hydrolase [Trueperaceae bacterium]|nr:MBL fold metallo-hydrolase [Trueperaceae bacterium]
MATPDLTAIDLHHAGVPEMIAAHALDLGDGTFALVDPGPGATLPRLEAGLAELGLELDALGAILVSHVHLDHAGAAGALAGRSGATVYAHPRAAIHLADPSRLLASATRVYGDLMDALWGPMEPVPEAQLRVAEDGEAFVLGRHRVHALAAPGHAGHQHAWLLGDGRAFPGDAASIRLPGQDVIMPATAPPEIDLEAWPRTLDALAAARLDALHLPHFGVRGGPAGGGADAVLEHLERVRTALQAWTDVARAGIAAGEDDAALAARLERFLRAELAAAGVPAEGADRAIRAAIPRMCAVGLRRALRRA